MLITPGFEIVFNRTYALRQEYELARKEYDEVFDLPYDAPDRRERFQAARERIDRARGLLASA
jgi:predicted transcriptional regulator